MLTRLATLGVINSICDPISNIIILSYIRIRMSISKARYRLNRVLMIEYIFLYMYGSLRIIL
jgi:hypothetical protein